MESSENCSMSNFSYENILNKVMQKQPNNRFESFALVREAIGKHEFSNMEITDEDKKIYQTLTNKMRKSLVLYKREPRFNKDVSVFISRMNAVLTSNLFETYIQKNADVISSIVESSYQYDNRVDIEVNDVRSFLDWFKQSTLDSQMLILKNIISKLSTVKVEEPEEELPF